jgi:hypothetical protein
MGRRCTVCDHPARDAIDAELAAGRSERLVAHAHGLARSAVHRHLASGHRPGAVSTAATAAVAAGAADQPAATAADQPAAPPRGDMLGVLRSLVLRGVRISAERGMIPDLASGARTVIALQDAERRAEIDAVVLRRTAMEEEIARLASLSWPDLRAEGEAMLARIDALKEDGGS